MSSRKRIQRKNPWQPTPAPDILKSRPFSNGKGPRESRLPTTSDILQTRPFSPSDKNLSPPKDTRSPEQIEAAKLFGYNAANIPSFAPSTPPPTVQREEEVEENAQEQAESGISTANIPVFAPSIPTPLVQREEVVAEDAQQQAEAGISTANIPVFPPSIPPTLVQREEVVEENAQQQSEEGVIEEQPLLAVGGEAEEEKEVGAEISIQRLCDECQAKDSEGKEEKKQTETIHTKEEIPGADAVAAQVTDNLLATRSGPRTGPSESFSYATIKPLTNLGCGGFDWKVQWQVENQRQGKLGFVVQKVEYHWQKTPCNQGFTSAPETNTYWEAWPAINDEVYQDLGREKGHTSDRFYTKPEPGHYGINAVQGNAKFIPEYQEPKKWGASAWEAGNLLSTYSEPSGWSDDGTIVRHVVNDFNCCPKLLGGSNKISEMAGGEGALSIKDKRNINGGGSHQPSQIFIPIPGIPAPIPITPLPVPL